jgi:PleD family two-component response regulator
VTEPILPSIETVYDVNANGWQQLQGSSTMLPSAALRFLVLVNGKLSLQQIATQLKDVPEEKLRKLALNLEQKGYIQQLKVGEPTKAAAFDVIDFFSGHSVDSAANASQTDQDQTHKLEAEAQSFTAMLKSQGYAVRIARQVGETIKPTSGNAYSVLYIDDAQTLLTAVCAFLEMEGFLPRRAANRLEVVTELRKLPSPDLILLDVELPDINGFNILESLRGHPSLKYIPVIMITGRATREDVMRALAAGANGYITKPLEFDSLLAAIKAVLGIGLKPRPEA